MTLLEAIDTYGPCVHVDDDHGLAFTINGSYLNVWCRMHDGWENTDCRHVGYDSDLYSLTVAKAMEMAEAWCAELWQKVTVEE